MSTRLLLAAFICATIIHVNLDSAVAESRGGSWIGTVTMADGKATLHRGSETFRAVRGAGIQAGDTIHSSNASRLSVALSDGPAITLGSQTSIGIDRDSNGWSARLISGQARVVHDGATGMKVSTVESTIYLDRSLIQVGRQNRETQVELVAGSLVLDTPVQGRKRLSNPAAIAITPRTIRSIPSPRWETAGGQIRLAAAMQTTPQLQPPGTNGADATNGIPEGDTTSPSDRAGGNELQLDDVVIDENEMDEDDDELPRFQQPQPTTPDTRGAVTDAAPDDDSIRTTVSTVGGSSSLSLGSFFGFTGSAAAGASNNDANQQTLQGVFNGNPFPGAIHLLTAEQRYDFSTQIQLTGDEINGIFGGSPDPKYASIGQGTAPTGQVVTNFFTGTGVTPNTIDVPRFDLHLIELDQYAYPDPARGPSQQVGIAGLVGATPTSPTIVGATPLPDNRSANQISPNATFALGEFLVEQSGGGIQFAIRRSDQDRTIIKDPGGNDANDIVTPNPDLGDIATGFTDEVDPRFLPAAPTVKEPVAGQFDPDGTTVRYPNLDLPRQAAFTTFMADQLKDYARRTNQTRFVVDGKIIDISGYRP